MAGEPGAEFAAGAKQTRLGGCLGNVEFGGHVGQRHAHGLAKKQRFAEERGDAVDLLPQEGFHFAAAERLLRRFGRVGEFETHIAVLRARVIQIGKPGAAGFPKAHQALVDHDAAQPRGEAAVPFEAAEMEEHLGKGILDFIFGILKIPENGAGEFQTGLIVPIHQFGEGVRVATTSGFDQIRVCVDDSDGRKGGDCGSASESFNAFVGIAHRLYEELMSVGVCREQARMVLPQNLYTEYYYTTNVRNLMHFIELRTHEGAQWEIQQVAQAMLEIVEGLWPVTVKSFRESQKKH